MLLCAAAASDGATDSPSRWRSWRRGRVRTEVGGEGVGSFEIAGRDRREERGRRLGDGCGRHGSRRLHRIARGGVLRRQPGDARGCPLLRAGVDVGQQAGPGEQLEWRVEYERVGGRELRYRKHGACGSHELAVGLREIGDGHRAMVNAKPHFRSRDSWDYSRVVPSDFLSIGDVARRTGVAVSAVRYYEREGLLSSRRSEGGQRRFHRDVLRRVAFIPCRSMWD